MTITVPFLSVLIGPEGVPDRPNLLDPGSWVE